MTASPENDGRRLRILLVRTSALGDVVQGLPTLTALRERHPEAEIGWAVDEAFATLLEGHAHLDRVLPVPLRRIRRAGERHTRDLVRAMSAIRRFRADVAIDLMGNHKGALLARLSGARRRIGPARAERRERTSALWANETVSDLPEHAVDRMLRLAAPLGVGAATARFDAAAFACGRDLRVDVEPGAVLLHPGAAWANKRYPPELWGAVAATLAAAGRPVAVGSGPGEGALAEAVVRASAGAARAVAAPDLPHLAALVRGAALVAAGDTGATHLAVALGRPVVAVHGPTDPARHGPWRQPDAVVVHRLPCSFCHQRMDDAKTCLRSIPPSEIAARILDRLGGNVD